MLKISFKSLIVVLSLIVLSPVMAGYQMYMPDLDEAQWRSSGNRLECRLIQNIPGYGEAGFKHRATRPMEFRISSDLAPRKSSQALVFVNPPNWKPYARQKILGRVPVNAQKDSIILPTDWAYRMADELHEGMEMVWRHPDWSDGEDIVTAKVRPLRFDAAWRDFLQCRTNLIDYTYQDVKFSEFYFPANSTALTTKEKKRLDTIAEYVSLDPDFQHILIHSFSDSRGVRRLNLAVSQKRADAVRTYLIKKGVDKEKFMIVAQGEQKPKYNNRTAEGRAKNRRVEVKLIK